MKIQNIFTNFLATDILDIDNDPIKDFVYKKMSKDNGRVISNMLGWQSNFVEYAEELEPLIREIEKRLQIVHMNLGFKPDHNQLIDAVWLNVNGPYSSNTPHKHEGLFSGVYYVEGSIESGSIVFMNPIDCHEHTIQSHMYDKNNEFNSATWIEHPQPGKLIIFPSWLIHYVKPNLSKNDRISIAFNTRFV